MPFIYLTPFSDLMRKKNLKNKATSNIKYFQNTSSLSLKDVKMFLRYGPFSSDVGIISFHPLQGTHRVLYNHEGCFDSYGITPPQEISRFITKQIGHCFFSEYKKKF